MSSRRQRFVIMQVAWMAIVIDALAVFDAFSLDAFVIASFLGMVVLVQWTAPISITPAWRGRLKWLLAFGLITFVAVIVRRALRIFDAGVF